MQGELICAWCNKKKKDIELVTGGQSHGICPACLLKVFGFTAKEMHRTHARRQDQAKLARSQQRRERREARAREARRVR